MTWQNAIFDLLAKEIGLDVSSVGPAVIERAVLGRIAALGVGSPTDYLTLLAESATESNALIEEVVVPESWFFRDGQPFGRLQSHLRGQSVVRILSLPCAGGEEAYSIAIALREIGLPPEKFHIDAVDISSRALIRAETGVYGPHAFRGPEFCDRSRYFRPHSGGWELNPDVRGMVHFQQGNLLDPDLLGQRPTYDAIFCRNLLIYLTAAARRQAVDCLDRRLAKDGLLFVGHAEALSLLQPRFSPDADRASFAYRRAPVVAPPPFPILQSLNGPRSCATRTPCADQRGSVADAFVFDPRSSALRSPRGAAPRAIGRLQNSEEQSSSAALLDQAAELTNRQEHDRAIRLCQQALDQHGPEPRTFVLLGMIELARGQAERAETNLLKAVYLDGDHDEALLALALIAERRGDGEAAFRYHRRAERARRAKGTP